MRWNSGWPPDWAKGGYPSASRIEEGQETVRWTVFPTREIQAAEVIGDAAPVAGAGLRLEPVDEVDDVEEAAAGTAADAGARDGNRGVAFAGAANQHGVAPLLDGEPLSAIGPRSRTMVRHRFEKKWSAASAGGKVAYQRLVRGGRVEIEVVIRRANLPLAGLMTLLIPWRAAAWRLSSGT